VDLHPDVLVPSSTTGSYACGSAAALGDRQHVSGPVPPDVLDALGYIDADSGDAP
jgi:hypothetical protein